jgi:hypothetical protein
VPSHPLAVDPGAVEGIEILDLEELAVRADERVPARDLGIVDDKVRVTAAENELRVDLQLPPAERTLFDDERGHGVIVLQHSRAFAAGGPFAAAREND